MEDRNDPEEKAEHLAKILAEDIAITPAEDPVTDPEEEDLIRTALDWIEPARKYLDTDRYDYGEDNEKRTRRSEFNLRMLLQYAERLKREKEELKRTIEAARINLNYMSRDLDKAIYRCSLYEDIAKDKAKRARKLPKDHTGYTCVASREVMDKYDHVTGGKTNALPVVAYRTTLQMPYPSALGFTELRRLLEVDLVRGGKEGLYSVPGMGYVMGIDRIMEDLPVDGKHPGPEELCDIQEPACILYRVSLNLGKRYAEVDLYTTAPLDIPPEYYA